MFLSPPLSVNYPVGARTVGEVAKRMFAEESDVREANQTRTRQHALWQRLLAARKTESGYEVRCFRRAQFRDVETRRRVAEAGPWKPPRIAATPGIQIEDWETLSFKVRETAVRSDYNGCSCQLLPRGELR
jgi:hypothetical protein